MLNIIIVFCLFVFSSISQTISTFDDYNKDYSLLIVNNSNESLSASKKNNVLIQSLWKNNFVKVAALVDKSVTFTCSIDLDDVNFFKSENYKIIWSREIDNGKDYEPLGLDDIRLIADDRIKLSRITVTNKNYDQIQWTMIIDYLKVSDSKNYICQLNTKPYDTYWLKKFFLSINEPAYFVDDNENNEIAPIANYENSIFVKSVNEYEDLKLKCVANGRPKPSITWYLRYMNGTVLHLDVNSSEIIIKSIKRTSKIDRVECQVGNGYGAKAVRSFKINIKHSPYVASKPKIIRVPLKTNEFRLNCSVISNPLPTISWQFIEEDTFELKQIKNEFNEDSSKNEWKSLNLVASYSLKYTHDQDKSHLLKLPLTKYHISEKHLNPNHVISVLEINTINEKDFGTYRCLVSNDIANKTVDFKVKQLSNQPGNSDKMRSLSDEKLFGINKLNQIKMKNSKTEGTESDEIKYDYYLNEELYSSSSSIKLCNIMFFILVFMFMYFGPF